MVCEVTQKMGLVAATNFARINSQFSETS